MKNEIKQTAHSSYRCEYHIVFAPKYRRKIIYKELKQDIIDIFKKPCKEMKVEIIERSVSRSYTSAGKHPTIHEYSTICRDTKEQKCADDFRQTRKLKVQVWKQKLFGVGYYVDTVGKNVNAIERYIMGSEKTTSLLGRVPKVATPIFFYRGRALGCVENARNTYSIPCAFLLAISLPLRKIRALRLLGHALNKNERIN